MDTEELSEKVKDFLHKAKDASKSAFDKAGDKVQEFSDKSVTHIEIKKLESALDKKYTELGKLVFELIKKNALTVSAPEDSEKVKAFESEIDNLLDQKKQKEDSLK